MSVTKIVYTAARRDGKVFWTRIGTCDVQPDGELLVRLDALPVSGELRIRAATQAEVRPYVQPNDRYIVTFCVGYEEREHGATTMAEAAELAAQLIAEGAVCRVHDRQSGEEQDLELSVTRNEFRARPWGQS